MRNPSGHDPDDSDAEDSRPAARRRRALGEGHRDIPWIWTVLQPDRRDAAMPDRATDEEVVEGTFLLYYPSHRVSS